MMNWEYKEISVPHGAINPCEYSILGVGGWELVTIISRPGLPERAIFKRPVATNGRVTATKKVAK